MSSRVSFSGWRPTVLFLAVAFVAIVTALLVGVDGNAVANTSLYVASASLILAWVHRWRRPKKFVILLVASVLGFPLAVLSHNLLYALGEWAQEAPVIVGIAEFFHVLFFLTAILICPAGVVIGGVGSLVAWGARRRERQV